MPAGTAGNASGDKLMDDKHRNILRRFRKELAEDMEPEKVLRQMVDPHLFTAEDEHKVKAEKTRLDQCEKFLDMLVRKGDRAYGIFMETIGKVHPHLANVILSADDDDDGGDDDDNDDDETLELRSEHRTKRTNSTNLRDRLNSAEENQTCSQCPKLEKELGTLKRELKQIKLKNDEEKTLLAEKFHRRAKLRGTNERHNPVQEYGLEEVIKKEREEKEKIELKLCSEKSALAKKLRELKTQIVKVKGENERFKNEIKRLNKALETKNKNHRSKIETKCDTRESDELTAKLNRLSAELEQLRDTKDKLDENIKTLETKSNSFEWEIKTKECEITRLRKERDSIEKANADSIQKIEDLKEKIKTLEKNERYQTQTCPRCHEPEMDCDALEDERLKEVLQAKNEELIRQNEELKGENKRLRSNNETSNCDRLLIRPQQPQPVLGQHPWKYNKRLVNSVSLKVEGEVYCPPAGGNTLSVVSTLTCLPHCARIPEEKSQTLCPTSWNKTFKPGHFRVYCGLKKKNLTPQSHVGVSV